MKKLLLKVVSATALAACASACGFVGQQLADKAGEERLLKPGALDASLTGVRDTYQFKFLDKLRVSHDWPRNSNGCAYRARPTLDVRNGFSGEFFAVADIFELDGSTYQSVADLRRPPRNFDQYVRSKKVMAPVWDTVNGVRQKVGEKEIENGWTPVCAYAWAGTNHALDISLFKRSTDEWAQLLPKLGPVSPGVFRKMGNNNWKVFKFALQPPITNRSAVSGPFEVWILPVGDTGYTLTIRLGANLQSLENPQIHAQFQAELLHLIQAVKIEAL